MIHELGKQNSILNEFLSEMRDAEIQKDSMRFRRNLERTGEICAYEISKTLEWVKKEITTPLGISEVSVLKQHPVLATILRAGLPFHQGMLNVFDKAENSFVSAYRRYQHDGSFDVQVEYMACPDLNDKILILSDPMLATGVSIELVFKTMLRSGRPKHIHIVTVIASAQAIDFVKNRLPNNTTIWACAIDEELTAKAYIVPGLGDAGDLAFGAKGYGLSEQNYVRKSTGSWRLATSSKTGQKQGSGSSTKASSAPPSAGEDNFGSPYLRESESK